MEEERESILGGSSNSAPLDSFYPPPSRLALAYIRFDYASCRFSPRGCALSTVHCHRNRDLCSRGVLKIVERLGLLLYQYIMVYVCIMVDSLVSFRGNSGDSGNLIILHHPKQGFVVVGTNDCVYGFDHDWCNNVQRVAVRQGRLIRTMSHLHIAPMIQRSYLMTYRIEDFSTRTLRSFFLRSSFRIIEKNFWRMCFERMERFIFNFEARTKWIVTTNW